MINKSKCAINKLNKINHKNLIKRYKINFNPLLLPKLALIGYQIKNDPSFQVFMSKLHLFDKSAIERQNIFIEHMKQLMMRLESEGEEMEEKILLLGIEKQSKKEIKSCINLEEDKYKYGKILTSRLMDLNQFIFHVQRLDRQPIQQKQCKNILEREINKINRIKSQHRKGKEEEKEEQQKTEERKKYFKMNQFKLNEMNKNIKNVDKMLNANKIERKYKKSKTEVFGDLNSLQYDENLDQFYQKQGINTMEQPQDQGQFILGQLVTNIEGKTFNKPILKPQDANSRITSNGIKLKKNIFQKSQTEASEQLEKNIKLRKKRQQGKSVRYNIRVFEQNQVYDSQKNKATSIVNIRSSRSIIKSDKQSRGSQSQILSKSRHFLQNNKKKSIKINLKDDVDEQSDTSEEKVQRRKSKIKTVKFSEQLIEQKNSYIKPKRYVRKFGRKETKIFFNKSQSIDGQNGDLNTSNKQNLDSKKQLNSSKIIRRDAFQQQTINQTNSVRSVANMKRKGRILGIDANKHLQRLLMEQNIQEMLIDNELFDKSNELFQKYKNRKHKGKYSSRRLASDASRSVNRSKTGKHNILMEVDLDNQSQLSQDSHLYVSNEGLKVDPKELKNIRQNYVQIMPYHHKQMAQYYGGEHFECINHQFNTNEHGQYFFNRLVMQTMKNNSADEYIPYKFPQSQNLHQALRFDFGRQLSKQLSRIQQKDMKANTALISYF